MIYLRCSWIGLYRRRELPAIPERVVVLKPGALEPSSTVAAVLLFLLLSEIRDAEDERRCERRAPDE